jgi:hypothetical protein
MPFFNARVMIYSLAFAYSSTLLLQLSNIEFAGAMMRAGVQISYGLPALKTHAKMLMVERREGALLRRYVHFGTGEQECGMLVAAPA